MSTPSRRRWGAVRKLPSGRWQARYHGPDGTLHTAPTTYETRTTAARWLSAVEVDMARGTWLDPAKGSGTLTAYASAWIGQRTVKGRPLAPRTRETYRGSLDRWITPTIGALKIADLTPAVIRTWHAEMVRDAAVATAKSEVKTGRTASRQAYALLRAVMSTAVEDGMLPRNPCTIRGAGQASSPERPLLDVEAVRKLAAGMPDHLVGLVWLGFWGGLRLGELIGLQRRDLDLTAGTVTIARQLGEVDNVPVEGDPKAGSARVVNLHGPGLDALREHVERQGPAFPTARVFTRADGSDLRRGNVYSPWRVACRKAQLPGVHVHDLRHAGLTLAAQSGATLAEVMRRAGHVSVAAAMTYQHAAERRDAEVAEQMTATVKASEARALVARGWHDAPVGDLDARRRSNEDPTASS